MRKNTRSEAYRNNPIVATTVHAGPGKVADFCLASWVGTKDLAGDVAAFQTRVHPFHLKTS
jgi:hypothetical protein